MCLLWTFLSRCRLLPCTAQVRAVQYLYKVVVNMIVIRMAIMMMVILVMMVMTMKKDVA